MANIRNSISMTDRMTPTLRAIMKSMDSTLRVMKNLDKAANNGKQSKAYKQAEKDIQRANNALKKMGNYTDLTRNSALSAEKAYRRVGNAVSDASNKMKSLGTSSTQFLQSLASGVYLAQKLANAVGNIMTTADESRSQVARLGLYNNSQYTNEELYGSIFRTAMNTRSDISSTSSLVNRVLLSGVFSGENSALSAIGTADIINKALVAGGSTTQEANRALLQLTQGLSQGILQGQDLKSIREHAPYLAMMIAEGLEGVDPKFKDVGIGDLRELGAEGELTADRVIKAFWNMQEKINADFDAMPKTFGQATTSLSNIWKYFLWMLSDVDGPLGKINQRLWTFVDYLQSAEGMELLNAVAIGINLVATAISSAADYIGQFVVFLQDNTAIAQAAFIALGTVAVVSAVATFAAWVAATWPILLVIGLVGLLAYQFLKVGYTAEQVVGMIVGGILWVVAVLWDAVVLIVDAIMWVVAVIVSVVIGVVAFVILTIQMIVQLILFAVNTIVTILGLLWTGFKTILAIIGAGFKMLGAMMVDTIYAAVSTILGLLSSVASVIDSIFGTNLSSSVEVFTTKVDDVYSTVKGYLDVGETFDNIGDMWSQYAENTSSRWSMDSDWIITDNMKAVGDGAGSLIDSVMGLAGTGESYLQGMMVDPNSWYAAGSEWGSGVAGEIGSFNLGIPTNSVLDAFNADGVQISGGYLDGIKSDVNISDEDVQLMRDMAARDFLLQLQSVTPVANVTFGDVRETADVNKILDVIETMVEEQMATALVS